MRVSVKPETGRGERLTVPVKPWLLTVSIEVAFPPATKDDGEAGDAAIV